MQKPVVEPPQVERRLETWWIWAGQQQALASTVGASDFRAGLGLAGRETTVKACGVTVERLQGKELGTYPVNRLSVNVGTIQGSPSVPVSQSGQGQVRRRLKMPGWDGALVVVRGRESRPHGEGGQQKGSGSTGRSGGRR